MSSSHQISNFYFFARSTTLLASMNKVADIHVMRWYHVYHLNIAWKESLIECNNRADKKNTNQSNLPAYLNSRYSLVLTEIWLALLTRMHSNIKIFRLLTSVVENKADCRLSCWCTIYVNSSQLHIVLKKFDGFHPSSHDSLLYFPFRFAYILLSFSIC